LAEFWDLAMACDMPPISGQVPSEPDLLTFAAITDDPPEEIAAAGHDRCSSRSRANLEASY